jgi:hypothetical protein
MTNSLAAAEPFLDRLVTSFLYPLWVYDPTGDLSVHIYSWVNRIEGVFWLAFAGLVLARFLRHRRSALELAYALAFLTFGLSDFVEAFIVQPWLILFKGINFAAIIVLRWIVIGRYYPESRTY